MRCMQRLKAYMPSTVAFIRIHLYIKTYIHTLVNVRHIQHTNVLIKIDASKIVLSSRKSKKALVPCERPLEFSKTLSSK
eukprot:c38891_g1_i1 orf=1-234(-)